MVAWLVLRHYSSLNKIKIMKKTVLVFGVISGLIISVFMATSMAIMGCSASEGDMNTGMIIGFASMAAAFSFVFVGIKSYRDKQNGGVISFGKGFLLGLLISLIASTMYVITWGIEYHYFMPDFMDKYSAMMVKHAQESGKTGIELEQALKEIETAKTNYSNPVFFALYTYMEILPVGILISLISALILKRNTKKEMVNV
jgi:hypothetical protein